jgi:adenosine deaminase
VSEAYRRLPRAELHVHLDGSLRPATLLELARAEGVALPAGDAAGLRSHMRVDDARNLADYLERFRLTVAVLQSEAALERVAYEMVADAAADGVRYLEVRYCPALSRERGLSLDRILAAQWRGMQRGRLEFGVAGGLIVCTLRHFDPGLSEEIAEAAVRQRTGGVLGFDIAGGEATHPAGPHRRAFEIAARGGLAITVHAGEAAGPASIAEALFDCRADRIGHGTRLFEDPALTAYVRDREIPIEINLTSNLQTRVVARAEAHPLRRYLDAGLTVTLCSDNWLMSDVTLSGEYARAAAALALTGDEIRMLARTGFRAAFAPRPERLALAREVEPAIAEWPGS